MHEVSLCHQLASAVTRAAGSARVTAVYVDVGALRQVVPEAMEFAWPFVVRGTALAGAALNLRQIPATLVCDDCGAEVRLGSGLGFACRVCGSGATRLTSGEEFTLVAVDVDDAAGVSRPADDVVLVRRGDGDGTVPPS